jgi:hypothetical protein
LERDAILFLRWVHIYLLTIPEPAYSPTLLLDMAQMKRKMESMDMNAEPAHQQPHLDKEGDTMEGVQPEATEGPLGDDLSEDDSKAIDFDRLLLRPSPFGAESGALALAEFESGAELKELLEGARVLVVGAGGLGCEILKNLALSGIKVRLLGITFPLN